MKKEVYNLITIKDGNSDSAEIIRIISEMAAGRLKYDLNLINYYDEVPISYGSSIVSVGTDSVELAVHEHQALIIKNNNSTLIKCGHLHNGLDAHCYAAHVSVPKRTVILHNFSYAQIRAVRREAVRVKIHGTLPVTFSAENVSIQGFLVDISGNGISIACDHAPDMNADQPVQFNFALNGTLLEVPGLFVASAEDEAGKTDFMFKIRPDRTTDRAIGQFIYQRQVEIIQQLKDGFLFED